jgi:hypothetical protein
MTKFTAAALAVAFMVFTGSAHAAVVLPNTAGPEGGPFAWTVFKAPEYAGQEVTFEPVALNSVIALRVGHLLDDFTINSLTVTGAPGLDVYLAGPNRVLGQIGADGIFKLASPYSDPLRGYFILKVGDASYQTYTRFGFSDFSASGIARGVPEPATWAMMIIGFGAVGTAVRRRRSVRPA